MAFVGGFADQACALVLTAIGVIVVPGVEAQVDLVRGRQDIPAEDGNPPARVQPNHLMVARMTAGMNVLDLIRQKPGAFDKM